MEGVRDAYVNEIGPFKKDLLTSFISSVLILDNTLNPKKMMGEDFCVGLGLYFIMMTHQHVHSMTVLSYTHRLSAIAIFVLALLGVFLFSSASPTTIFTTPHAPQQPFTHT
ncbi:hypothetical protein L1887_14102 [Cichorium endivia]|nr:hypothetical protein L1887_14102 [Cichorium endivia]